MIKQSKQSQSDARQDRIEEIRIMLCENSLTTSQIEYLTGLSPTSLRNYLTELEQKNYIAHVKQHSKKGHVNLYRITCDGKSLKPRAARDVVDHPPAMPTTVEWWKINLGSEK
jgi:predicted transcriptional regulator